MSLRVASRAPAGADKRRAVVFAEYFPPYMSSDRRLFHLVSNLKNWDVSAVVTPPLRVLTQRCERALLPYGENFVGRVKVTAHEGIPITYLPLPKPLHRAFRRRSSLPFAYAGCIPALAWRAIQLVRALDPDICIIGHPSFITGVVGVIAAKLNGKPILLDYPDAWTPLAVETGGMRSGMAIDVLRGIESTVARAADHIVVITDSLARYVRELGARAPVGIVSNGAELDRFRPPELSACSSDGRPFRVLFAGRLERWSGVDEMARLVQAVALRAGDRVEFHFVGDGGAAQAFQRRLELLGLAQHCRFEGFQPYWMMPELIATCDLALLPFPDTQTTRVSSPVKLFEYMAMGKPVIATDLPGVREAVGHGEAIIVDHTDAEALADQVVRLMDSPAECARIGAAGRQLVNERFGWRHLAGLFETEMERTMAAVAARETYSAPAAPRIPSANSVSPP